MNKSPVLLLLELKLPKPLILEVKVSLDKITLLKESSLPQLTSMPKYKLTPFNLLVLKLSENGK